jgi:single-strand DNA-binding protein
VGAVRLAVERAANRSDHLKVTAFGNLAVACPRHLAKGRQVAVDGRLAHSEWRTDFGERRERHEVIATSIEFLGQVPAQPAPVAVEAAA